MHRLTCGYIFHCGWKQKLTNVKTLRIQWEIVISTSSSRFAFSAIANKQRNITMDVEIYTNMCYRMIRRSCLTINVIYQILRMATSFVRANKQACITLTFIYSTAHIFRQRVALRMYFDSSVLKCAYFITRMFTAVYGFLVAYEHTKSRQNTVHGRYIVLLF
jgi:hypothetical protein